MDSEHRHELAENDLARILKQFGSRFEGKEGPIVAGLIAICVIAVGYVVVRSQSSAANQQAWQELASATIAENYATVAGDYPGTEVAAWAKVNEGRLYLQEGIRKAFQDKEESRADLERAKDAYQAVLENPGAPDEARSRAMFGMATYLESVSDGDTAPAIAAYQRYIDEFPGGVSESYAEQRVKALGSDMGKEFYAWFSEQEPVTESTTEGFEGLNLDALDPAKVGADGEIANPFESLKLDAESDDDSADASAEEKMDAEKADAEKNTEGKPKAETDSVGSDKKLSAPTVPGDAKEKPEGTAPEGEKAPEEPSSEESQESAAE